MARSLVQSDQMVNEVALSAIGTPQREPLNSVFTKLDQHVDSPCRMSVSGTTVTIGPASIETHHNKKSFPFLDGKPTMYSAGGSVNLNASGSHTGDIYGWSGFSGLTIGEKLYVGFDLRSDGKIYIVPGKQAPLIANLGAPIFLGISVGVVLCEALSATTVASLDALNVYQFIGAGAGGAGGDSSFKIRDIAGTTATIAGGQVFLSNGEVLVSGAGTIEENVKVDISIDLSLVLGSSPADATIYYLYIDRSALAAAINLTDSGRKVINVSANSHFKLLTTAPDATDLNKYVSIGFVRSATTGTAWTGTGSSFGASPARTQYLFEPADVEAWATGVGIRSGNIYKVTTEGFEGFWRAKSTHTAGATFAGDFETDKWELVSSWMGPREVIAQPSASFFAAGNVAAVNASGAYVKGLASDSNLSEVKGFVSAATATYFILSKTGSKVTLAGGWTPALTAGAVQFLSGTTAGAITATEPTTVGYIRLPLGQAISTTTLDVLVGAGTTVGGTNLYTTIPLNNGTATTIQNLSSSTFTNNTGGYIEGHMTILQSSGTNYGFDFKVNWYKVDGSTIKITPEFNAGDVPPGFAITDSGANINVSFTPLANFSSGSATFCMQAAPIGAQLPLQIDSSRITWQEPTMFRNRIINGCMRFRQRYVGGTSISAACAITPAYYADRWWLSAPATWTWGMFNDPSFVGVGNRTDFYRITRPSGDTTTASQFLAGQDIEMKDSLTLSGRSVTLSFDYRTYNMVGTLSTIIQYRTDGAETGRKAGPSGWFSASLNEITVDTNDLWVRSSLTASIPANATMVCVVFIYTPSGTAASTQTIDLTNVQLEPGTSATPFEFRPYGTELALCQRYCEVLNVTNGIVFTAYGSATSALFRMYFGFQTAKRVTSYTITNTGYASTNLQNLSLTTAVTNGNWAGISGFTIAGEFIAAGMGSWQATKSVIECEL